jgi:predicted permease
VLTLATGLLFGLAPALQATRPELHAAMKTDAAGRDPRVGNRLQALLVGAQVAVCMVLMIAAGLLLRGLRATHTVEPGFDYENVVVASFDLGGAGYDTAAATEFQRRLEERVRAVPGVESVAQAAATPLTTDDMEWSARLPGQDQWLPFGFNRVSADYFSLVGVPVVRGRTFTVAEIDGASPAAIVTETTARHRWPGVDPIGQTLTWRAFPGGDSPDRAGVVLRVVGVARDAQITQIGEIPSDYVYLPATPQTQASLQLLVRSRADFAATAAVVRAAVTELDPGLVVRVAPLEANLDVWRSLAGLVGSLSTSLGVLALVLASVGVYGVVAYAVGSRVREIGIRMALGASARDVLALVLRRTMRPIVAGAVIGVAAAFGVSRVLSSVLFGVSPSDPLGLGGAALFVTAVALAVSVLAARPATHADPMTAFRHE